MLWKGRRRSVNIEDRTLAPDRNPIALLKLIRQTEANGDYNAFYAFKNPGYKKLTEMTLDEVRAYQEGAVQFGATSSAAGAYQIIRKTFDGLRRGMRLSGDELFDEDMQDRMAVTLLEGRGLGQWQRGGDWAAFAHELSREWASFPRTTGPNPQASFYDGHAGNRALVSVDEVRKVLV